MSNLLQNKRILITGHLGLIGGELYRRLQPFNYVTGYDRESESFDDKQFDLIIHTAANCRISKIIDYPVLAHENDMLTFDVLELARKQNIPILLFSSGRVEHDELNPYNASKRYLEMLGEAYRNCYGLPVLIIRPETVWGPGEDNDRVINKWINSAIKGDSITIRGPENKELSPLYVTDFVQTTIGLIHDLLNQQNDKWVYNITGQPLLASEVAQIIIDTTHSSSHVDFIDAELTQPQQTIVSDFALTVSFEQRVKEYIGFIYGY